MSRFVKEMEVIIHPGMSTEVVLIYYRYIFDFGVYTSLTSQKKAHFFYQWDIFVAYVDGKKKVATIIAIGLH